MNNQILGLYTKIEELKTEIRKIESKENVNSQAIQHIHEDVYRHICEHTKKLPTIVPKQDYIDMCEKYEADIAELKEQNDRLRLTIQERNIKIQKLKQLNQDKINVQRQAIKELRQKLRDTDEELARYINCNCCCPRR